MIIDFDDILFFITLFIRNIIRFYFNIIKNQEKKNRTKTDSGTYVEDTLMRNKNIEGTRQINSVTSE